MPPAGALRISGVTHSRMRLNWDAAPGQVRKYIITYKPEDAEAKEVRAPFTSSSRPSSFCRSRPFDLLCRRCKRR